MKAVNIFAHGEAGSVNVFFWIGKVASTNCIVIPKTCHILLLVGMSFPPLKGQGGDPTPWTAEPMRWPHVMDGQGTGERLVAGGVAFVYSFFYSAPKITSETDREQQLLLLDVVERGLFVFVVVFLMVLISWI